LFTSFAFVALRIGRLGDEVGGYGAKKKFQSFPHHLDSTRCCHQILFNKKSQIWLLLSLYNGKVRFEQRRHGDVRFGEKD